MDYQLLPLIGSPHELKSLSHAQLELLASEIREALCDIVADRPAHFASNLGVVELCIALHLVFDFSKDRLIWDTGHQIYPHKLVTGRFPQFQSIRCKGGLMGYPNPVESDYDLFLTGHAGSSVSTLLGLRAADDLLRPGENRRAVAVIGDGALPSGIVFEAFNNVADKNVLVILNDNKMGICPRVGGMAQYLDRARVAPFYDGLKKDVAWLLNKLPVVGESAEKWLVGVKDAVKGFLHGGMLFEELGFRYIGPVDGHDLRSLRDYLELVKDVQGPVLLHVFTEKGRGFKPAENDPVKFHTPSPFCRGDDEDEVVYVGKGSTPAYTDVVSEAIEAAMQRDERVCVLTAAMCEGNKLGRIRDGFPDRFFDTGICEGHAVAFAGGLAKAGMRPVVDIYSTFLQRSFDQIFQEVALQNLPVAFCLDRAGLCGPDGPTHHGLFDNSYMRVFPNLVLMAPGDAQDVRPMLDFALRHDGPTSIRYPKTSAEIIERSLAPLELGRGEVLRWGTDGAFLVFGALLGDALRAAEQLEREGLDVAVVSARFLRPLDVDLLQRLLEQCGFVITVEENTLCGGFGSAVLEAANAHGWPTTHVRCLGIPDRFIEHGERGELLAELGLDQQGFIAAAREMAHRHEFHSAAHDADGHDAVRSPVATRREA